MKLRSIVIVLTIAFASAAAYAQSGVYLTMDAQQFTQEGVLVNPGTHGNIDRPWLFGPGYGVYFDINHLPRMGAIKTGPVVIGVDARGETLRDTESYGAFDQQDGIFSLRVATKNHFFGTTPYIQGGVGIGHTKVPFRTYYSNNLIYQFSIGADRPLRHHIDWRVVEASAGFLGSYHTGYSPSGFGPNQSNYMVTLGTGLVFRLH